MSKVQASIPDHATARDGGGGTGSEGDYAAVPPRESLAVFNSVELQESILTDLFLTLFQLAACCAGSTRQVVILPHVVWPAGSYGPDQIGYIGAGSYRWLPLSWRNDSDFEEEQRSLVSLCPWEVPVSAYASSC